MDFYIFITLFDFVMDTFKIVFFAVLVGYVMSLGTRVKKLENDINEN